MSENTPSQDAKPADSETVFHQLALDYRTAVSITATQNAWAALWAHVNGLHGEISLLRARALATEEQVNAMAASAHELGDIAQLYRAANVIYREVTHELMQHLKKARAGQPLPPIESMSPAIQAALEVLEKHRPTKPVEPAQELQQRRWCSPCQEYATTQCVGDPHECPLTFPKG